MRKKIFLFCLLFAAALYSTAFAAENSVRILDVYGTISAEGEVSFEPAYAMVVPENTIEEGEGEYNFIAMTKDGHELASTKFHISFPALTQEKDIGLFGFSVLFPKDTDHFVMKDSGGNDMAILPVSAHLPEAVFDPIIFDTTEPFTLSWTWGSSEGLKLYAELYYIFDGFYKVIDFDITNNYYEINFEAMDLPDSDEAMFLLVVSDSVNTIEVYSNVFSVPGEINLKTMKIFPVLDPENDSEQSLSEQEETLTLLSEDVIILTIDSKIVTRDGIALDEPQVAPQIINGRTMLPFRYLAQTVLGGEVKYIAETREIKATVNGHEVSMVVGQTQIVINGEALDYGQAPMIKDNITLVPLKAFEKVLSDLKWDTETRRVMIFP